MFCKHVEQQTGKTVDKKRYHTRQRLFIWLRTLTIESDFNLGTKSALHRASILMEMKIEKSWLIAADKDRKFFFLRHRFDEKIENLSKTGWVALWCLLISYQWCHLSSDRWIICHKVSRLSWTLHVDDDGD